MPEAEEDDRFVDGGVRVLTAVDADAGDRRAAGQPAARTSGTAASRAAASACSVETDAVS